MILDDLTRWAATDSWARLIAAPCIVVLLAWIAQRVIGRVARRVAALSPMLSAIVERCRRPFAWVLPLIALSLFWQGVPEDVAPIGAVRHLTGVLAILALTWMAMNAVRGVADGVVGRYPADAADNLEARRIHTQARVLARIAAGVVLIAGLSFVLMTFPTARQLGASLLASAGVSALVVGLAARSVFGNLLAGLQIALAQPIRIDDVLIVEGEWGRVEEITATYVVLRIWDQRRLIIPLQWFIDHPFQNWTRSSAEILGSVFLWVDFSLPIDPVRAEATRLCESVPELWDGRLCIVQVTDTSERAMQLRALVSAASSGQAWDLRCKVREGVIDFIRREYPGSLPRVRSEAGEATPAAAWAAP